MNTQQQNRAPAQDIPEQDVSRVPAQVRSLSVGGRIGAIVPQNFEDAYRLAKIIATAGWAPKSYMVDGSFNIEKICIGIMHGMEVGFTPIAALQSIAVINGMPSIYGDGALALCQNSGIMEDFSEEHVKDGAGKAVGYKCRARRRGVPTVFEHTFTMEDAEKAKLKGKSGPWQDYPLRMCQMRARAWTLRAAFADVLKGLSIAEEAHDTVVIESSTVEQRAAPRRPESARSALDAFAGESPAAHQATPEPTAEPEPTTAAPEATRAPEGERKPGLPQPSKEIEQQFVAGDWKPMWKWLSEAMMSANQDVRGQLEFVHAEVLTKVRMQSDGYAKAVDDLLTACKLK